jgi:hypothetical protein
MGNPIEVSCQNGEISVIFKMIERPISVSERCPGWTFQIFFLLLTENGKGPVKGEKSACG